MTLTSSDHFTHWFRSVAPYVRSHRGKRCVLLIPETLFDPNQKQTLTTLTHDLAILHSLGLELIITFSLAPLIPDFETPRPVDIHSPDLTHRVAERSTQLQALLSMNLPHSPMQGAQLQVCSGNWVTAQPYGIHQGINFGALGKVRKIAQAQIDQQLQHQAVILIPPLGNAPTGECFGLAAGDLATQLATTLSADKLILFSTQAPLKQTDGTLIRDTQPEHLNTAQLTESTQSLAEGACYAVTAGVDRCHIIDPSINGSLFQELFSREGSGTLISAQAFESIRAARSNDITDIMSLTQPLEASGAILHRSQQLLTEDIHHFYVIERDQSIIACAALYPYPEQQKAEIACIAVAADYQKAHRGERLLAYLEKQARHEGLKTLFVLTTQSQHWFQQQGFTTHSTDILPPARLKTYKDTKRNSLVLTKML